MATATSRRAAQPPKALKHRRELAEELVAINRKLADDYARMAAIESELKTIATDQGESFIEDFTGEGKVSVSGAVASEFKGNVPVIQTEVYLALAAAEQKQLVKSGVVKIEPQWGRASSGKVTVKVY